MEQKTPSKLDVRRLPWIEDEILIVVELRSPRLQAKEQRRSARGTEDSRIQEWEGGREKDAFSVTVALRCQRETLSLVSDVFGEDIDIY